MTTHDICNKAIKDMQECSAMAQGTLKNLSLVQFNWKPAPDSWSIAEVLSHLLNSNGAYFPKLTELLSTGKNVGNQDYKPTLIGGFLIKMLDPSSTRKLKNPAKFNPSQSRLDISLIDQFTDQNKRIEEVITGAKNLNLNALRLSSPAMFLMRYSVADTFVIFGVHQLRHFGQIRRILDNPAFPR